MVINQLPNFFGCKMNMEAKFKMVPLMNGGHKCSSHVRLQDKLQELALIHYYILWCGYFLLGPMIYNSNIK